MESARRSIVSTVTVVALVFALLLGGGILVRRYVGSAFSAAQRLDDARNLLAQRLTLELDQETGVRGYAATGDPVFLEPYRNALPRAAEVSQRLDASLTALGLGAAPLADARTVAATWSRAVAEPTLRSPKGGARAIQQQGKVLMDRFRADVAQIDAELAARERVVGRETRAAIDRINLFVGGVIVLLLLAGIGHASQQMRAEARVRDHERRAEDERRRAAALQAAYVAEKRIADTLQEAFTQRPLPTLPTLRFSATYVPATEEAKVGGDWYDALELPGDRALFVIGDVTGHGIDAAVAMSRARQSLISSALVDPDPAAVLARVNSEILAAGAPLVTAVVGFADASTYEFVYAIAGHPPPVLQEPGRPPRLLECGSLPLGAIADPRYRLNRLQSVPGATLILYTDGAVEHTHDVVEGEALLLDAVARVTDHRADPAAVIHEAIFHGRQAGDDVAILTIGFAAEPAIGLTISADQAQTGFAGRIVRGGESRGATGLRLGRRVLRPASAWGRRAS